MATANASGALADRYVYTPYGVEQPLNATGQPLRYNARRFDPESGLYHYRARAYNPSIGLLGAIDPPDRWLAPRSMQTDPVLYADQMNLYAYVGNDPLNATDPSGMCPESAGQGIGIVFTGKNGQKWGHTRQKWEHTQ